MKEKLQVAGIGIVAWLCFFMAILAPWCVGVPATLDLFGVYELPITIPLVLLWKYRIFNMQIGFLTFLFVALPIIMGTLFIYYTCVHLFAPKVKIVTITQEEFERMNVMIDELNKRKEVISKDGRN